jgi:predicted glycoside hydrolase/deacetylase ChbG (UPF0249 family)
MMKNTTTAAILFVSIPFFALACAQRDKNLAERLGYEADATLLIVHADDIGLGQSVNIATARAFDNGGITSGSVMVPCPGFSDFAAYYEEHQPLDVGIHITLTAEWESYKWGGITPAEEIPSLLDENGHFYPTVEAVAQHADPVEAEKEMRAQIEHALAMGIRPTHLDTHMGSVMATPELLRIYLKLGQEYELPVLTIPRNWSQDVPEEFREVLIVEDGLLEGLYMMYADDSTKSWSEAYGEMLASMGPGLNQLIVHLAVDDAEMQAIAVNHPDYGSAWRQRDLDFVTSQEFRDMLQSHDIKLVSWDQIREMS